MYNMEKFLTSISNLQIMILWKATKKNTQSTQYQKFEIIYLHTALRLRLHYVKKDGMEMKIIGEKQIYIWVES